MFRLSDELKVYVHRDAVDFRKSINGLAAIVEQSMKLDPFEQAVYVFSNQR
ncbi:IS66 family insertion sequence element accessory protein TnpB, partial [Paraburkholderia graminis]